MLRCARHIYAGSSWAVYQIDNQLTNPYASWVRQGCPPFPSALQLDHIRANEEPRLVAFGTTGTGTELSVDVSLPLPSVALVLACGAHGPRPATPRDVRVHRVSRNRTLLYWRQPRDGCTSGYRLLFSARASAAAGGPISMRTLLTEQIEAAPRKQDLTLSPPLTAPHRVTVICMTMRERASAAPWP
ncbi:hypothetical protein MRX96_024528 [Rhipicephalus microplus]